MRDVEVLVAWLLTSFMNVTLQNLAQPRGFYPDTFNWHCTPSLVGLVAK